MIEYRCPVDDKLFFKAGGPVGVEIEIFCPNCKRDGRPRLVQPVAKAGPVFLRTCQCSKCHRTQTISTPVDEPGYCIVCGTRTLVIIEEIRPPVEAVEAARDPVRIR